MGRRDGDCFNKVKNVLLLYAQIGIIEREQEIIQIKKGCVILWQQKLQIYTQE